MVQSNMVASDGSDFLEHFLIIFDVSPEILFGTCVLSLIGIVVTYFATRRTMDSNGFQPENNDEVAIQQLSETSRAIDATSMNATSSSPEIPPCRKNLCKIVTDELQKKMTTDQMNEENQTKRKQLEAIFDLMRHQQELFGVEDIKQIEDQMKLYG